MADLSTGSAFVAGTTIVASAMNTRFTNVETWAKGTPDLSTSGSMTTVKGTLNVDEAVTFDSSLTMTGALTVGVDGTGHDVKFYGDTTTRYMEWDQSADKLTVNKGDVLFAATDSGEKVHWNGTSSDPVLIIHGTSNEDVLTVTQGRTKLAQRVYCQSTDDVDLDAVSGALIVGNADGSGQHVAIDGNEIQSKSDGTTAADLFLNPLGAQVILYDGSVSAPSLKFANNDADTGFYRLSSTQIGVSANAKAAVWTMETGSVAGLAIGEWTGSVGSNKEIYRDSTYGTLFVSSSKRALKDDIQSVSNSGAIVDALNPVTFIGAPVEGETEGGKAWRERDLIYGFIAEEVAEIADGKLALYDVDGETLVPSNWKTRDMVALLAAELKSVRQRLAALEA